MSTFKVAPGAQPPRFNAPGNIAIFLLRLKGETDYVDKVGEIKSFIEANGYLPRLQGIWYYTPYDTAPSQVYCAWQFSNDREREQFELLWTLSHQTT